MVVCGHALQANTPMTEEGFIEQLHAVLLRGPHIAKAIVILLIFQTCFFFGGEVEKVKLKVAWANIQVSFLLGTPSESDLSFPAFRMAWVKSFLIPQESVQTVTASEGAPIKLRSFLTFQGFTITDGLQYHYKRFGIF